MARFELVFKRSVAKDLRRIPNQDVARILARVDTLRNNPRPGDAKKLSESERYRLRQGVYCILYEIEDARLVVTVVQMGHRREQVYRRP